jgi:hypothetical protein
MLFLMLLGVVNALLNCMLEAFIISSAQSVLGRDVQLMRQSCQACWGWLVTADDWWLWLCRLSVLIALTTNRPPECALKLQQNELL